MVNTPSEPLPITGTATGTVYSTNTLKVNAANKPTVRTDPTSSVRVAPAAQPGVRLQ